MLSARLVADLDARIRPKEWPPLSLQVPTVLIARTDADSATLLTSDIDEVDRQFCTGERTPEGFFKVKSGVEVRSQNPQNPQRRS